MEQVYIFDFGDKIKVGRSGNVQRRLRTIECASGVKAKNVYTIAGGKEEEKTAHDMLENRLEGEYFAYPFNSAKDILDRIASGKIPLSPKPKQNISVSNTVKALLYMKGKKQADLAAHFDMKPQSMANKMSRGSFSAEDLIEIAKFTDCRVAFVMDDGQKLYIDSEDDEKPQE